MEKENNSVSALVRNRSFWNWVEGRASRKEADFWDNWIRESEVNQKLAIEAQQRILGFSIEKKVESRAGKNWAHIDEEISQREQYTPVQKQLKRVPQHKLSSFTQILKVAAIILVMATGGLLWYAIMDAEESLHHKEVVYQQITTEYGEQKEISLPDGSQIILNSNSSLRYATEFEGGKRRVDVELDGEAYFSVTSRGHERFDASHDIFRVATRDGSVRVLGTRFTVSSWNEKTAVVLEEGAVSVVPVQPDETVVKEELILQPNELVEYSRETGAMMRQTVNTRVYTSWKDPRLFFENTPVWKVLERFEQTFGAVFEVNDASLLDRSISGSVENANLETMVRILGEILDTPVKVTGEVVYVGGFDSSQ